MSHYAVAVFADNPDDFSRLMIPYDEDNEDYFVFDPVTDEEILREWEKFKQQNPMWSYSDWLAEFYTLRDGRYGHWYNPHGYYDYYAIGGRDYMYEPLPSVITDDEFRRYYRKSELDWFNVDGEEDTDYWRDQWKLYSQEGDGLLSSGYYRERYSTEDQYVKEMLRPVAPYAFVTPDGAWHAPGRVGWFASSDETAESQDAYWEEWCDFIRNAPDCYVTIVDCHI